MASARIVSSRSGQAGEWSVEPNKKPESTNVGELLVQAGDAIDFVVDLRGTIQNDSFAWTARLQLDRARPASEAKSSGRRPTGLMGSDSIVWDSAATFRKPVPQPLDVWSRYIQVLLMSNEFIYVD